MENKSIPYEDIRKEFGSYLKIVDGIPFSFFFDNEEISHDKFKVLFDYLEPTLPLLSYVTMLRTENPDVTCPFLGNPFLEDRTNEDGLRVIKFNSWVGYYSEMVTSLDKDLIVEKNNMKNYILMYKYIVRLKNSVRIIEDFFFMLSKDSYLTSIYKELSHKTLQSLINLTGFYGNYTMDKKDGRGTYPFPYDDHAVYIHTPARNNIIYNPFTVENQNLPVRVDADLTAARGGIGNPVAFIPQTRTNIIAQRLAEIYQRQESQNLLDNQDRVIGETLNALRVAT